MTTLMLPPAPHLDDATLDDLVDGLLPPHAREAALRHLGDCVACRASHDELVSLLAAGRAARSAVTVPPDLWTVVSAATVYAPLVRRHTVRTMRPAMLLGGGLLILGSVIGTSWLLEAASAPEPASELHGAAPMSVTDVAAARAESARLEQRLRERVAMLNPEAAAPLRATADRLALHRGALGALQTALREQPYDPYVAERLAALATERRSLFAEARRLAGGAG